MKKYFILLAAALFAVSVSAQIERGTFRFGGTSGLDFTNIKFKQADYSTSNISLKFEGSYFFVNNFALNAEVFAESTKDSDEDDASTVAGVGFGVRYYLPVKVFFGASIDAISTKYRNYDAEAGTGFTLQAGYAAFLNDKVALEPSISYRTGLSDEKKGTQFDGLSIQVGFSIYF